MPQCAFCPHEGKLTLEHVFGDKWLNPLFPGKKRFTLYGNAGQVVSQRASHKIDWTAKVVCSTCNNTWMSEIENNHAKPAMIELITGSVDIPINQSRANSIALFAFKAAVVIDESQRDKAPFFSRRVRYAFRENQTIPPIVQMWMCGFVERSHGQAHASYHKGTIPPAYPLELYAFTCVLGHFGFQLVAVKQISSKPFLPRRGFEHLSVPLWPTVHPDFVWPPSDVLRTRAEFLAYSKRWIDVRLL